MMLIQAFIFFTFGGIIFAESLFLHKHQRMNFNLEILETSNVTTNTFIQKLDHFEPADNTTWKQYYYSDESFYQKGGPVYLWIGGEWEEESTTLNNMNYWLQHGRRSKAMFFSLEHRYYGRSLPFSRENFLIENIRYLNTLQALADTAAFIESMNEKHGFSQGTKWVVCSCSYGGMLAAWMRLKYPHLVYGALASSAPVLAKMDFPEYEIVVGDAIAFYNKSCQKDIATANKMLEEMESTQDGRDKVEAFSQQCFRKLEKKEVCKKISSIQELMSYVASKISNLVQNNIYQGQYILEMCDKMLENATLLNPVDRYFNVSLWFLTEEDESKSEPGWNYTDSNAWSYQACTEFGYFPSSRKITNNTTFDSGATLDDYINENCKNFNSTFTKEFVGEAVKTTNMFFGGLKINVSRTIFTHGSLDPWHSLGVLPSNKMAGVDSILIEGASHCGDLYSMDFPAVNEARKKVEGILDSWLKL